MMKIKTISVMIALLLMLSSCTTPPTAAGNDTPLPTEKAKQTAAPPATEKPQATKEAKAQVYMPEDLLNAAEATKLVGYPVKTDSSSLSADETNGTVSLTYVYDVPRDTDGGIVDTVLAILLIEQNGMKSADELQQGHSAKWSFEKFKADYHDIIADLPDIAGAKAFSVTNNQNVHFLFQDYYVAVCFVKDSTNDAANLNLNKSIAEYIVGKLSLAPLS